MIRDFRVEEIRKTIEEGYGVSVQSLKSLNGHAHSFNFRAETSEGMVFVVKCFPAARTELLGRLLAHTAPSHTPLAATRIFGGKVIDVGGWKVMALKWIPGSARAADELSDRELDSFLVAYERFLSGLSDDGAVMSVRDGLVLKRALKARFQDGNVSEILRELDDMPDGSLTLAPGSRRIIHGDLHKGNFRFVDGAVSGFFDLEELRFGTPAEDLVRYVVCCEERRRWYDLPGRRRLLNAFRRILAKTSYPRAEWMFAVNGCLLRKLAKKVKSNRLSIWRRINLHARLGFYRALRKAVESEVENA